MKRVLICLGVGAFGVLVYWVASAGITWSAANATSAKDLPPWALAVFAAWLVILFRDGDRKVTLSWEDRDALKEIARQAGRVADAIHRDINERLKDRK